MKTRKSRSKAILIWPTATFFSVKELYEVNKKNIPVIITLRSRLHIAIDEEGIAAEVGFRPGEFALGRPEKLYAKTPITKIILDIVEQAGHQLVEDARKKFLQPAPINQSLASFILPRSSPVAV